VTSSEWNVSEKGEALYRSNTGSGSRARVRAVGAAAPGRRRTYRGE